jgi:hypothetical protein
MPHADSITELRHFGVGLPVHEDISSEPCMTLAGKWIKKCQEQHPECKQPDFVKLPTRVLDVGSSTSEPHLVESSGQKGNYAALSHCWGKHQLLTTTMASLVSHQNLIHLADLPKTFQDAVMITRSLGLKYLWIDSLCIIQDSKEDWETESARMAKVYSNAVVTIAAVAAEDSTEGCFVVKAAARPSIPVALPEPASEQSTTVFIRRETDSYHDITTSALFSNLPLSRRAWVLQERLLSTRILLYTNCELVFECRSDLWCECGSFPHHGRFPIVSGYQFRQPYQLSNLGYAKKTATRCMNRAMGSVGTRLPFFLPTLMAIGQVLFIDKFFGLDRNGIYSFWHTTVHDYTRRCLTYDRDVLPALSGIADLVRDRIGDKYLAGLWRDDLPSSLLWARSSAHIKLSDEEFALLDLPATKLNVSDDLAPYVPRRTTSSSNEIAAIPPTWSWASLRADVNYGSKYLQRGTRLRRLHQQLLILHAETTLVSKRFRTGSVSSGLLRVYGDMKEVRLVQHERHRKTLLHRCRVADFTCAQEESTGHKHTSGCMEVNQSDWAVLDLPPSANMEETRCWRLRIGVLPPPHDIQFNDFAGDFINSSDTVSQTHVMQYFLLLVESTKTTGKRKCLERVGLYIKGVEEGQTYDAGGAMKVNIV